MIGHASRSIHRESETVLFKVTFSQGCTLFAVLVYDDMMFSRSLQDYVSSLLRLSLRIKLI